MPGLAALTLASLAAATGVPDAATDFSPPPGVQASDAPVQAPSLPHLGASADVGVPTGAGASLVLRPWSWLRLSAGGMTNSISGGIRAGVSLAPFHAVVAPTLSAELGRFFDGDANGTAAWALGQPSFHSNLLTHVGYDFADAMAGLELGPPDRWVVSLRAGLSYIHASASFEQALQQVASQLSTASGGILTVAAPGSFWAPGAQLGLTVYFL
jgi:hypothetical protein